MAGEKEIAQVAQVEANAAQAVADVAANAAAVIENAARDVAAAQEGAQAIVEAALQTPLAQKIADIEQEADQWESEVEERLNVLQREIQSLETLLQNCQTRLTALETAEPKAVVVTVGETAPLSNPLNTDEPQPEATITEAVIVTPAAIPESPAANIPAAPKQRTRFL